MPLPLKLSKSSVPVCTGYGLIGDSSLISAACHLQRPAYFLFSIYCSVMTYMTRYQDTGVQDLHVWEASLYVDEVRRADSKGRMRYMKADVLDHVHAAVGHLLTEASDPASS